MVRITFLLKLIVLAALGSTTTAEDDSEGSLHPHSFLRQLQTSNRCKVCPALEPFVGARCCVTSIPRCDYGHTYQWSSDCQTVECRAEASFVCKKLSTGRMRWESHYYRRSLGAADCSSEMTSETPPWVLKAALKIGQACIP
jgi:hypothetical protein